MRAGPIQFLTTTFAGAESARPHYELLIRMIDDEGHTIGPDRFMSAAQRYQLMPAIDRWVVRRALDGRLDDACSTRDVVLFAIERRPPRVSGASP